MLPTNSFFSAKTFQVPAAGEHPLKVTGNFVIFTEADAEFEFRIGANGEWLPSNLGLEFRLEPGELFTELTFRQLEGAVSPINVKALFGVGKVEDRRLNVITGRSVLTTSISPADILAINPADITVTGAGVAITTSQTYSNKRMLSAYCRSGTVIAGGLTLAAGESVEFPALGRGFKYGAITVDASGGEAIVVHVG